MVTAHYSLLVLFLAAMVLRTFSDYLEIIDEELVKRSQLTTSELLEFLKLTQVKDENRERLTESRLRIWFGLAVKKIAEFSSPDLVSLWKTLAEARIEPDKYIPKFFTLWEKRLVKCLEKHELLDVLEIYSKRLPGDLNFPFELLGVWCRLAEDPVSSWTLNEFVEVILRFYEMKIKPVEPFLSSWMHSAPKKLQELKPKMLADLLYALGKLEMKQEEMEQAIVGLVSNWERNQTNQMKTESLIKLLEGLCELKIDPTKHSTSFLPMFLERLTLEMKKLSHRDLARAPWLLARLELDADAGFRAAWVKASFTKLTEYSARDLHLTLVGAVHLRARDREFATAWTESVGQRLGELWASALASIPMDVQFLGGDPEPSFYERWMRVCSSQLANMYTRDLVTVIVGMALCSLRPDEDFLKNWFQEAKRKGKRFSSNAVEDVERAFEDLQIQVPEDVKAAITRS